MALAEKEFNLDNKRLGYLIKRERIKQNISIRALAEYSGITAQFLSDIEHGKKNPADYTLARIENALDIELSISEEYLNYLKVVCKQMYLAYANFNEAQAEEYFNVLKAKEDTYLFSYGLVEFLLSKLIYYIYMNEDNLEIYQIIDELRGAVFLLDEDDQLKFYDICGYHFTEKGNNNKAKEYFDKAIKNMKDIISIENAMLFTHLSIYYQITNQLWDGLICCDKSIEQFVGLHIFERVVMNQGNKAINYSLMGYYDKAEKIFLSLLENELINNNIKSSFCVNLANCYLRKGDYKSALDFCLKALELGNDFSSIYTNIVYLCWKLNDYNRCKKYIRLFATVKIFNEYDEKLIKIFDAYLNQEEEVVINLINSLIQYPIYNSAFTAYSTMQYYLKISIDILKEYKAYEKVVELYELKESYIR